MGNAGLRSRPIEPNPLNTGPQAVFPELVILPSVDNLAHVWVLHRKTTSVCMLGDVVSVFGRAMMC